MRNMKKIKSKRHYLLLEVMIALAIIVMCVLPLMYPHVSMLQAQKRFIKKIELDHVVSLLYAKMYEQLQRNEIPWSKIEEKGLNDIDQQQLKELNHNKPLPYTGTYKFAEKHKSNPENPLSTSLVTLTFYFTPKDLPKKQDVEFPELLTYEYKIFVAHLAKNSTVQETQPSEEPAPQPSPPGPPDAPS